MGSASRPQLHLVVGLISAPAGARETSLPASPRRGERSGGQPTGAPTWKPPVGTAGARRSRLRATIPALQLPAPHRGGIEGEVVPGAFLAVIRAAAENGVDWVQVRDHQASARDLYELARVAIEICRPLGVRVAVNDRLDVALAAGADAAQLGTRSLPLAVARELARTRPKPGAFRIGASVHDLNAARRADAEGADWVTYGHVYPSASHPGVPPQGLAALSEVVAAVGAPVIAIGGVDRSNVGEVLKAGASGVAVISAILSAPDPGAATAELRRALDRYSADGSPDRSAR